MSYLARFWAVLGRERRSDLRNDSLRDLGQSFDLRYGFVVNEVIVFLCISKRPLTPLDPIRRATQTGDA